MTNKSDRSDVVGEISAKEASRLRGLGEAWVRENLQGLRVWPEDDWVHLWDNGELAGDLNFSSETVAGKIVSRYAMVHPLSENPNNTVDLGRGVELDLDKILTFEKEPAAATTYYTDLNDLDRDLISLYTTKDDVYRSPEAQVKFYEMVVRINNGALKENSELAKILNEALVRPQQKISEYESNIEYESLLKTELRNAVDTLSGGIIPEVENELTVEILKHGRPDITKSDYINRALSGAEDSFGARCLNEGIMGYWVAQKDWPGIERILRKNLKCYGTGPDRLTRADILKMIRKEKLTSYFSMDPAGDRPDNESLFNMTFDLTPRYPAEMIADLKSFGALFEELRNSFRTEYTSIKNPTRPTRGLNAEELKHFPEITPGKCKVLVPDVEHEFSSEELLGDYALSNLFKTKTKIVRTALTEDSYKGAEKAVIKDRGLLKIINTRAPKTSNERG